MKLDAGEGEGLGRNSRKIVTHVVISRPQAPVLQAALLGWCLVPGPCVCMCDYQWAYDWQRVSLIIVFKF